MKKEKMPADEGKEDSSAGCIEIDLSGIKNKLDGIRDRIDDTIAERTAAEVKRDMQIMAQKGRVGLSPSYARAGYAFTGILLPIVALVTWFGADVSAYIFIAFMLLLSIALIFIGKYEIRYDEEGFDVRIGKRVLRHHAWSDVTDVIDSESAAFGRKQVIVRGKKLLADASMIGFEPFYIRARRQIKGGGKTVPSQKKQKNRKKAGK